MILFIIFLYIVQILYCRSYHRKVIELCQKYEEFNISNYLPLIGLIFTLSWLSLTKSIFPKKEPNKFIKWLTNYDLKKKYGKFN